MKPLNHMVNSTIQFALILGLKNYMNLQRSVFSYDCSLENWSNPPYKLDNKLRSPFQLSISLIPLTDYYLDTCCQVEYSNFWALYSLRPFVLAFVDEGNLYATANTVIVGEYTEKLVECKAEVLGWLAGFCFLNIRDC